MRIFPMKRVFLVVFPLIFLLCGCVAAQPGALAPAGSQALAAPAPTASATPLPADDEPAPEAPETDDGMAAGGVYRVCVNEYLSLRASDSADAPRMEKLADGELVLVLQSDGDFCRVRTQTGARGYVMSAYLVLAPRARDAFPHAQDAPGAYTVVCRSYLSLRAAPDAQASRLAKLPPLTQVELVSIEGDYAQVRLADGSAGYVLAEYLSRGAFVPPPSPSAAPKTPQPQGDIRVAACKEHVTLREKPDTRAKALARVAKGEEVGVLGYSGMFTKVSFGGREGYVLSGYLVKPQKQDYERDLSIVKPSAAYSCAQMASDLEKLAQAYPDSLKIESIGKSELGQDIPVAILGDPDAPGQLFVQAAIHGREHMTACLVTAQLEYMLASPDAPFGDGTLAEALEGVCIHIVPMSNPDGVAISQSAKIPDDIREIFENDIQRGYARADEAQYLAQWKANARGVDLNRNFNAGFGALSGPDSPSFLRYKGKRPENQNESRALADYVRAHAFDATVSYHAFGSVIYWAFGDDAETNAVSRDFGRALRSVTGYPLDSGESLDSGGFKDWAIETMGVPSLTVEIGTRECPLPLDEFASVYERNKTALAAAARWVRGMEGGK